MMRFLIAGLILFLLLAYPPVALVYDVIFILALMGRALRVL
jgi:hypothetical protein